MAAQFPTPLLLTDCQPAAIEDLKQRMVEYDFIRFTWTDLNGAQRGVTYSAKAAPGIVDSGVLLYSGGPRTHFVWGLWTPDPNFMLL